MMNAVQAIEDANKEIQKMGLVARKWFVPMQVPTLITHGELADVLPVGTLGGPNGSTTVLSSAGPLHLAHTVTLHPGHHQLQSQHLLQQGGLSSQQQQQQQQQQQHEPISPHHPHNLPQTHQGLQTPVHMDLDHAHPLPSNTPSTSSSLQMHSQGVNTTDISVEIASTSQRAHVCTTCLKGFRSKQQLAQHTLVHSNIRKYTCSYCERAFKQLSHLQQHTRIHTDKGETEKIEDRKYLCLYCERAFKQLTHLQQHTRLHTGEKPYSCKYENCERAFAQLSNLQHHMRNHEDQVKKEATRIHKCLICHRSYTNESSLKAHTLKMHIHLRQPLDGHNSAEAVPAKKRRKKKNKQLYNAPTMVPMSSHPDDDDNGDMRRTLSESSDDDDLIIIGEKRQQDLGSGLAGIPRSLVESLNHYERTLAAGMSGKKIQDGTISSQAGSQNSKMDAGRSAAATLGLQGLMGLPGIDPVLMSAQPPEVIERAAAAAAAAVSSQLLQSGHGLCYPTSSASSNISQPGNPQPAHAQNGAKISASGSGGAGNAGQPQLTALNTLDMVGMGGGQYGGPKPYTQLMDAHLRNPMTLAPVPEQYYAHTGPHLGMLSHHPRFLPPPRSVADLSMSYSSHAPVTAQLTLQGGPHGNSRPGSDIGSPHHVSDSLNYNA